MKTMKTMKANQKPRVFISYRRKEGSVIAGFIYAFLLKNYHVFLDVTGLDGGQFDQKLITIIQQSKHFVLVLTPGALDRCKDDKIRNDCEDWIHKETAAALRYGLNIIPVCLPDFEWPNKDDLPEDMQDICKFNAITYYHGTPQTCIDDIQKYIVDAEPKRDHKPNRVPPFLERIGNVIVGAETEPRRSTVVIAGLIDLAVEKVKKIEAKKLSNKYNNS